jgi:hypothetical protein
MLFETCLSQAERTEYGGVQAVVYHQRAQDKTPEEQQRIPLALWVGGTLAVTQFILIMALRGRRFYNFYFLGQRKESDERPQTIPGIGLSYLLRVPCLLTILLVSFPSVMISAYGAYESFIDPDANDEDRWKNIIAYKLFISNTLASFPYNYVHNAFLNADSFAYHVEQGDLTKNINKTLVIIVGVSNIFVLAANAASTFYSDENGAGRILYLKDLLKSEDAITNFSILSVCTGAVTGLIMNMPTSFSYFRDKLNGTKMRYKSEFDAKFYKAILPFAVLCEGGAAMFFQTSLATTIPKAVSKWISCTQYSSGVVGASVVIAVISGTYNLAFTLKNLTDMTCEKALTGFSEPLLTTVSDAPVVGHGPSSPRFLTLPEPDPLSNSSAYQGVRVQSVQSPRFSPNQSQF